MSKAAMQQAVEAHMKLVQAYAADCEAVALEKHCYPGDSWKNKQAVADITLAKLRAQLESAFQQQPEPVAKPSRVGEDGWRKLAESQAALLELANLAEDTAAELAAEIGANLPLERAIAGLDYFLTVKEDRRFIEGVRAELMKLSERPALQHQEVPREPDNEAIAAKWNELCSTNTATSWNDKVRAIIQHFAASPSTTRQASHNSKEQGERDADHSGTACDAEAGRIFDPALDGHRVDYCRGIRSGLVGTLDLPAHVGEAGHVRQEGVVASTTRQQEAGSGYEKVGHFMEDNGRWLKMDDIYADDPDAVVLFRLAAAPSTPENAGGVPDGVGGNDGR